VSAVRLWLVRHPRPLVPEGVCYGMSDLAVDADDAGRQAGELAALLATALPVFCSPLHRCRTLAADLQARRPDLAPRIEPRLRELDFGAWEGRCWSDIQREEMDAWTADFARHRPGGGESAQSLLERVAAALEATRQLCANHARREAVWITHAGVIRATRLAAAGVARLERAMQWPVEAPGYGGWTQLDLALGAERLRG